jgi:hypothetical protein
MVDSPREHTGAAPVNSCVNLATCAFRRKAGSSSWFDPRGPLSSNGMPTGDARGFACEHSDARKTSSMMRNPEEEHMLGESGASA